MTRGRLWNSGRDSGPHPRDSFHMKNAIFAIISLAFTAGILSGKILTIAWDPNPETDIAGYVLTVTTGDAAREILVEGKTVEVDVECQPGDVLVVRAFNEQGMHGINSDPLIIGTAPGKPGGLRARQTVTIEQSNHLGEWQTLAEITTYDSASSQRFWRATNP